MLIEDYRLARNAGATGDQASAREWLALCDERPSDLVMDSAIRMTWASLALRSDDWEGILRALGEAPGIPFASKYTSAVRVYRCHALEMKYGAEHAARILAAEMPIAPMIWQRLAQSRDAHADINLCPKSLELAALSQNKRLPSVLLTPAIE